MTGPGCPPRSIRRRPPPAWGSANTRARLAALYGGNATLDVVNAEGGGVLATVRLPYHEAKGND